MGVSVYLFGSQRTCVSLLELFRTVWPSFVAYICRTMYLSVFCFYSYSDMFNLNIFESYSDESELTYLVLCFFLLFLLLRLTSESGMVAKATDYVVNPQIWPHTARIYFAFLLGE
jgi:hypothetical protein